MKKNIIYIFILLLITISGSIAKSPGNMNYSVTARLDWIFLSSEAFNSSITEVEIYFVTKVFINEGGATFNTSNVNQIYRIFLNYNATIAEPILFFSIHDLKSYDAIFEIHSVNRTVSSLINSIYLPFKQENQTVSDLLQFGDCFGEGLCTQRYLFSTYSFQITSETISLATSTTQNETKFLFFSAFLIGLMRRRK